MRDRKAADEILNDGGIFTFKIFDLKGYFRNSAGLALRPLKKIFRADLKKNVWPVLNIVQDPMRSTIFQFRLGPVKIFLFLSPTQSEIFLVLVLIKINTILSLGLRGCNESMQE